MARAGLRVAERASARFGDGAVASVPDALRRRIGEEQVPTWSRSTPQPAPSQPPFTVREGAAAVYLPACINRMFGNARDADPHPTLPEALVAVSRRAGLPLWIPEDIAGACCGHPWSSKGYVSGHDIVVQRTATALARWSDGGRLPVVVDATSCTHAFSGGVIPEGVAVLDAVDWVHDRVLPRLNVRHKVPSVAVHATCASLHLGLADKLAAIADQLADEVVVPAASGCCGMAGDRGWLHPELPASALRDLAAELDAESFEAYISSNRTCEAALQEVTGRPYESFVQLLESLTRGTATRVP